MHHSALTTLYLELLFALYIDMWSLKIPFFPLKTKFITGVSRYLTLTLRKTIKMLFCMFFWYRCFIILLFSSDIRTQPTHNTHICNTASPNIWSVEFIQAFGPSLRDELRVRDELGPSSVRFWSSKWWGCVRKVENARGVKVSTSDKMETLDNFSDHMYCIYIYNIYLHRHIYICYLQIIHIIAWSIFRNIQCTVGPVDMKSKM